MGVADLKEANAFALKREGHFEESLQVYAHLYAQALEAENGYISQVCFDQMFDIELLQLAREEVRFETAAVLRSKIEHRLADLLREREAYDEEPFGRHFGASWRKFAPRGRGRSQFSIDRVAFVPSRGARSEEGD